MNLKTLLAAAAIAVMPAISSAMTLTAPTVTSPIPTQVNFDFGTLAGGTDWESSTDLDVATADFFSIEALFGSAAGSLTLAVVNSGTNSFSDVEANLTLPGDTLGTYSLFLDGVLKATVPDGAPAQEFSFSVANGEERVIKWEWSGIPAANLGQMSTNLDIAPVPVPAGILLMGTAIAGFGVMRRRKQRT